MTNVNHGPRSAVGSGAELDVIAEVRKVAGRVGLHQPDVVAAGAVQGKIVFARAAKLGELIEHQIIADVVAFVEDIARRPLRNGPHLLLAGARCG